MLALKVDARVDAPVGPANPVDFVAMELASLSLVLPAVVTLPVEADKVSDAVVRVAGDLIREYRRAMARNIRSSAALRFRSRTPPIPNSWFSAAARACVTRSPLSSASRT